MAPRQPALDAAVLTALQRRMAETSGGRTGFPAKRREVMLFQLICKDKGHRLRPRRWVLGAGNARGL